MEASTLKSIRESLLLSKAELARRAEISPITLNRIEKGMQCRPETKKKILLALGMKIDRWQEVFPEG